ncbi:hypothetical protein D3C78_1572650 [compost metagenome]
MASSRRRSLSPASKVVSMPMRPATTTKPAMTDSAVSATLIRLQSSCRAAPGSMAISGSLG